jgi:hypothetical protein
MKTRESPKLFSFLNNQDLSNRVKWDVPQKALQVPYLHPQLPLHKPVTHFKSTRNFRLLWRYV